VVSWVKTPCSLVGSYQSFVGTYDFHLQDNLKVTNVSEEHIASIFRVPKRLPAFRRFVMAPSSEYPKSYLFGGTSYYLFTFDLFNDNASISEYKAMNDRLLGEL
jgi:hypothetical protein